MLQNRLTNALGLSSVWLGSSGIIGGAQLLILAGREIHGGEIAMEDGPLVAQQMEFALRIGGEGADALGREA